MVKKHNHIWSIPHFVGRTQKLGHFKLKKFPVYGCHVLRGASPVITRQDTNMKSMIPPGERLTLTHSLSSEFCCNLYRSVVSHVTIFVILLFYVVPARKSLAQIDQLTGVIKTPVKLCCSNSSAAMLIFPRNHVTPNSKPFNKGQLVEQNRAVLYFHSTMFNNLLNGIFQQSTSHDTLFNIC